MNELYQYFHTLAISLGLGLLVGLQRQITDSWLAGLRTFALLTVLGTLSAMLAKTYSFWIIIAGLVSLTAIIIVGNLVMISQKEGQRGVTTEVTMIFMYCLGAYLVEGNHILAIALGGIVAVLLQFKEQLHDLARKLGKEDVQSIMQFVLLSLVILPFLPNQTFGPLQVLNPFEIWLMVVLVVGISLSGYIIYKFFGAQAGAIFGGILGGIISSTATTLSYSRMTKGAAENNWMAARVIMIASAVLFMRMILIVGMVSPTFLTSAVPSLAVMGGVVLTLALVIWIWGAKTPYQRHEHSNPSQLKTGMVIGGLYAIVIFAVAAAKQFSGNQGLYLIAFLSGLTDLDAITLSTAQLVSSTRISTDDGWKMILIGAIANFFFKGFLVGVLGDKGLFKIIVVLFSVSIFCGFSILALF